MANKYIMDNTAIQFMLESLPRKVMYEHWAIFEDQCETEIMISDKESMKILEFELTESESYDWITKHSKMFKAINEKEAEKLGSLVGSGVFEFYNYSYEFERRLPIATPFLISIAYVQDRKVVVHKKCKDITKISKICKEEHIDCINVEEYLIQIKPHG